MAKVQKRIGKVAFTDKGIYDSVTSYGFWDFVVTDDSCYLSLKANNVGHPVTEVEWWKCIANGKAAVKAAKQALQAANEASTQATFAQKEGNRAKEYADNPPKQGPNGNWWQWNDALGKYVDTGVLAKGGIIYPTFGVDDDLRPYMDYEDTVSPTLFGYDEEKGMLYLNA